MRLLLTILLLAVGCIVTATDISADDLGLIRVSSDDQAARAELILGHGLAKLDNQFMVMATTNQQMDLAASGIPFELLRSEADLSSLFMVLARNGRAADAGAPSLGPVIHSSPQMTIVESSRSIAASVSEGHDYFVIPLEEREIYFHYDAPMQVRTFSPAEVYPTDSLCNYVRKDSVYAFNRRLELFYTRYIWSDSIDHARDWLVSKFHQFGYTSVTTPTFSYGGGTHYNVKAVKTGTAEPNKVIVIGGHYDSINLQNAGSLFAPGSDDDGSGTTLTLEVARVLANVPLRKTVIFMPFSAEEQGLVGSNAAATGFRNAGTNVEAMLNYDMVGYVVNSPWRLDISSGSNTAYRDLTAANISRVTSLVPRIVTMGSSSDHFSFFQQGFPVCDNIETDFNNDGWHTNLDLTSRMNFDYLTEVVKLAVATVAIVANSASPTTISRIEDRGNGSSLELFWNDCNPQYNYTIIYGPAGGPLDSVQVPSGNCSQIVTGLAEGLMYNFALYGKPSDGYRAIAAPVYTEQALSAPRAPRSPQVEPGLHKINLAWRKGIEQDVAYYRIYRKMSGEPDFVTWQAQVTDTVYSDSVVTAGVKYDYAVTSVDNSGFESPKSALVSSYPATFDGGILVVDEWIQDYAYFPDQSEQLAYWDTIFGETPFVVDTVETGTAKLEKGDAGRFSSIFWFDEDIFTKILSNSNASLDWFLGYPTNVMIDGYQTIQNWTSTPVPADHLLRQEFGVTAFTYSSNAGFIGATGDNGWPTVAIQGNRGILRIYSTPIFTPAAGATVIYRMNAHNDDPAFEGQPCGIAYSTPNGKRIVLSFPLYYLTPASATALIEKAKEFFGESTSISKPGDVNLSGVVDLSDLSMVIGYLSIPGFMLPNPNGGDVNSSCNIDLTDLAIMVSYLIFGSPLPQPGCLQP